MTASGGPLAGIRIVEFAGIGPAPYAVMLLADMGAEVVRILRADAPWPDMPVISRGRASLTLDLKSADGVAAALDAMRLADVLVEGFRPGVMERLGLGPDEALTRNPRLIYTRITGWGQDGPRAQEAGHDINYVALSGLLSLLSRDGEPPMAPLNLLGDYAGGSLFAVMGILAALLERATSGRGQIVDAAIVDGAASLLAPILGMARAGLLEPSPARSMLAGQAAFYRTYRCSDGRSVAVGPLEPQFRRVLTERMGLAPEALEADDAAAQLASRFAKQPQAYWAALFDGTDACVAPVLDVDAAMRDPHLMARGSFGETPDGPAPMPAPRFSRTPGSIGDAVDGATRLQAWRASERH